MSPCSGVNESSQTRKIALHRSTRDAREVLGSVGDSPATKRKRQKLRLFGPTSSRWRIGFGIGSLCVILGAWWLVAALGVTSELFLPSPSDVANTAIGLAKDGTLGEDIWASFTRITIGFLLASLIAVPLGVLIGVYRGIEAALEPPIAFIRYMPAVAFVPLTIIWVGLGESQKWVVVFIGTFFQQVLMVQDDVRRVPREYVDIGYTLGLNEPGIVRRIVFPAAAPAIWDTLRITLGWAWTYLVVAELVAASSGLGYRSIVAQRFFQTDVIFVVIIVIGLMGLIMDQLMRFGAGRLFSWARSERGN